MLCIKVSLIGVPRTQLINDSNLVGIHCYIVMYQFKLNGRLFNWVIISNRSVLLRIDNDKRVKRCRTEYCLLHLLFL